MPRNDGAGVASAARHQPGRLMLVLRDAVVDDELVYRIATQYGEVKNVHRPSSNRLLVFVQYEDPSCADVAMRMLKQLPIFRSVDPAIKSDRFNTEKPGGGSGSGGNHNNTNNDDQQQKNMKYKQFKKDVTNQQQKQQSGGTTANFKDHNQQEGHGGGNDYRYGRNDNMNDVSYSSMEFGSQQTQLLPEPYQPRFSLGCWSCNKLPKFECRCGAFYCGAECQRIDWPKHKDICMPRMVPISYSIQRTLQEAATTQGAALPNGLFSSDQQLQMQENQQNRRDKSNKNQPNQTIQQKSKPTTFTPPSKGSKCGRSNNKLQRLKTAKSVVGSAPGILLPGVFPREGSMVKITASLPSGILYIYHNNGKDGSKNSDYFLLTNRMFQAAANAKPLTEIPSVDDVIFAPFH